MDNPLPSSRPKVKAPGPECPQVDIELTQGNILPDFTVASVAQNTPAHLRSIRSMSSLSDFKPPSRRLTLDQHFDLKFPTSSKALSSGGNRHGEGLLSSVNETSQINNNGNPSLSEFSHPTGDNSSQTRPEKVDILRMKDEKYKFTLIYCDMVTAILTMTDILFVSFYHQYNIVPQLLLPLQLALSIFNIVVLYRQHKSNDPEQMWIPVLVLEVIAFAKIVYCSFEDDFYKGDLATNVQFLLKFYPVVDRFFIPIFFQNTFILIELIESRRIRKYFLGCLVLCIAIIEGMAFKDIDVSDTGYTAIFLGIMAFALFGLTSINTAFTICTYYLQTLTQSIIWMELEENKKYKYMFNSIQDAIFLVKGQEVKFANSLGRALLFKDSVDQASSLLNEGLIDTKRFFLFQDLHQNEQQDAQTQQREKIARRLKGELSMRDLLTARQEQVNNSIFTTSQEISECKRLDQLQKIIQEENGRNQQTQFFQIKIIRIGRVTRGKKDNQRGLISDEEEIMIQIQDISLRVQSQYMRVERQYLSLMNSTVSHEMRNPLNAIISQISRQQSLLGSLENQVRGNDFAMQDLQLLRNSLRISKSSAKILRFNVEDILALPQLKSGKFTKNIQKIDIWHSVMEIVDIMNFQASEKSIEVKPILQGFPSASCLNNSCSQSQPQPMAITPRSQIPLDEQRFQQVLLNYLSNALKFTDKGGRICAFLQYVPPKEQQSSYLAKSELDDWRRQIETFYNCRFFSLPDANEVMSDSSSSSLSGSSVESEKYELSPEQQKTYLKEQKHAIEKMLGRDQAPKLVLSLMDSGLGIPVEEQTKLFKLFGTLKSTRSVNTKGVGLGLSICKMISEEFGGSVGLVSKLGHGSIFLSSFALHKHHNHLQAQKSLEQVDLMRQLADIRGRSMEAVARNYFNSDSLPDTSRVLIVDDEAYNCEVLSTIIMTLGVDKAKERVVTCMSGKEALEVIKSDLASNQRLTFSLIMTDLSMPVMDGYQLASKLRKLFEKESIPMEKQPTIVALTGHTETEFVRRALHKGMNKVFSKPISSEQISLQLWEAGIKCRLKDQQVELLRAQE